MTPVVNVPDVALIFEGGGMRAAYTSAVVVELLKAGLVFPFVAGISAGASNTANYLAGDGPRAKASFTTFAADPRFGGLGTFGGFANGLFIVAICHHHTVIPWFVRPGVRHPDGGVDNLVFFDNARNFAVKAFPRFDARACFFARKQNRNGNPRFVSRFSFTVFQSL